MKDFNKLIAEGFIPDRHREAIRKIRESLATGPIAHVITFSYSNSHFKVVNRILEGRAYREESTFPNYGFTIMATLEEPEDLTVYVPYQEIRDIAILPEQIDPSTAPMIDFSDCVGLTDAVEKALQVLSRYKGEYIPIQSLRAYFERHHQYCTYAQLQHWYLNNWETRPPFSER